MTTDDRTLLDRLLRQAAREAAATQPVAIVDRITAPLTVLHLIADTTPA